VPSVAVTQCFETLGTTQVGTCFVQTLNSSWKQGRCNRKPRFETPLYYYMLKLILSHARAVLAVVQLVPLLYALLVVNVGRLTAHV
jgi:hypothetical protein